MASKCFVSQLSLQIHVRFYDINGNYFVEQYADTDSGESVDDGEK